MQYVSATSIDEAVGLLAAEAGAAHVLAGGTDLVVQMTAGMRAPSLVVDIKAIPELGEITEDDSGFHIGSAVCGARINEHAAPRAALLPAPGRTARVLCGSRPQRARETPAQR